MKKGAIALVACVLVGSIVAGCGGQGPEDSSSGTSPAAMQFQDDAKKYYEAQTECPVCGETPIKKNLYVDTDGGRIYMDKEACVDAFKNDKQKFLQKFEEKIMSEERGRP